MGIPWLGLNGGPKFRHSEAFPSRSRRTIRRDEPLLECDRRQWRQGESVQLVQGPLGLSCQITARTDRGACGRYGQAKRAFDAMMSIKKVDIASIETTRLG
jgi:2-polyprenyl-6-hydroxyphenyl methylase/3-demethylubiquinone-9 3-methyltransferase